MEKGVSGKASQNGLYTFQVAFGDLRGLNHVALGIRKTASALLVRIVKSQGVSQVYCSMQERPDSQGVEHTSGPDANFLTHLLSNQILIQLQRQHAVPDLTTVDSIYKAILEAALQISNDVTTLCIHCKRPLGVTVARPVACSAECQKGYDTWPLETRMAPLLRDPSVLDLLLTCLTAQLRAHTIGPNVPRRYYGALPPLVDLPCPLDNMLDSINSFPPLVPGLTFEQLIHCGNGNSSSNQKSVVLRWLCSKFQGMIVPSTPSDTVAFTLPLRNPGVTTQTSFVLMNGQPEAQSKFEQQLKDDHNGLIGGIAAFHGTPPHNIFNIICNGLNQNKVSGGNVYYSREPAVSIFYTWRALTPEQSRIIAEGWSNSQFKGHSVLLGVEVAKPGIFYGPDHETNSHQDTVMVRHVFVLPPGVEETYRDLYGHEYWIQDEQIRWRMENTFRRIHDGRLLAEASADRVERSPLN
ncbi:hypothetical protein PG988_011397 [Apiospora saccharicola]